MDDSTEHIRSDQGGHALFRLEESYILAYNVERLRNKKHMDITKFARAVGISRPTVYKIERGRSDLKLSFIKRIANVLGVEITDLLIVPQDKPATVPVSAWYEAMREERKGQSKRSPSI